MFFRPLLAYFSALLSSFFGIFQPSPPIGRENLVRRGLTDPLAVCNDGSRAVYYDSNDLADSKKLHIYLKGGGGCYNFDEGSDKSCAKRCGANINGELCTASTAENFELDTKTMWSTDPQENPPFHDFARVYVPYCSSDLYVGTRDPSDEIRGFSFHGKYIVKAVADDIVSRANNLEQVVLYGTSAGAIGVAFNCDAVAQIFKEKFPNIDVRCVADGNDFFPVDSSMNTDTCDLSAGEKETFWEAKPDSSCMSDAGSTQDCFAFSTFYNHISTPTMVVQTLTDPIVKHECSPELTDGDWGYWATYRNKVKALADQFKQDKPNNGLWVPNCIYHVSQGKRQFWGGMNVGETGGQQLTLREALSNWISGSGGFQAVDPAQIVNPACPASNSWPQ